MVRKFLYAIAVLLVVLVIGRVALTFWSEDLTERAFVPDADFTPLRPLPSAAWDDAAMWIARPDIAGNPSLYRPEGLPPASAASAPPDTAVFFVHPTSFAQKTAWNAPLDDKPSRDQAALMVKAMASPFNAVGRVWAPRYRQATIGAFLSAKPQADAALDVATLDVIAAFDNFLKANPKGPIVLAGHSQGAFLLRRLIAARIAGTPVAQRVAAAYVIGWPVSIDHDLPRMGLPACRTADQSGCVISWLTVADPADTAMLVSAYGRRRGLDGQGVAGSAFVCTNPLTGTIDGQSGAQANTGTLVPDFQAGTGRLEPQVVPAACGPDHFLHIGEAPKLDMGPYVLPGNNYHLYDMTLFWANLRSDFQRRLQAWHKQQS
ncbi:DUF3089 domain-containing protein [Novosphingobium colocasiae]|uniref:DUF3089 domain-containing protein n=1 Tax=Novosphingobium colocasiae TaxID=1256513 RepID=UPI0035AF860B